MRVIIEISSGLRESLAKGAAFFFLFSDSKFRPAATHTTRDVGGRRSLGPADAVAFYFIL
jgi:hypothetical protein